MSVLMPSALLPTSEPPHGFPRELQPYQPPTSPKAVGIFALPKMSELGKAPTEMFESEESESLLLSNVVRPIVRSPLRNAPEIRLPTTREKIWAVWRVRFADMSVMQATWEVAYERKWL